MYVDEVGLCESYNSYQARVWKLGSRGGCLSCLSADELLSNCTSGRFGVCRINGVMAIIQQILGEGLEVGFKGRQLSMSSHC